MVLFESLRIALQSLRANPLRSLLTLIGISVGIAAVLHVVGLGRLTQANINERLESMGSNVLLIRPGYSHLRGVRTAEGVTSLTWEDARELAATSAVLTRVVPTYSGPGNAEYRDVNWSTRVTGTTAAYAVINSDEIVRGAFFEPRDVAQRSRVAVIGDTVRKELFADTDPIGERIFVNSQRFTVVGVLGAKGESWGNPDDQIFVPLTTAQDRLFGVDYVSSILAQMRSADALDEALFDIETLLRRTHRLRSDQENDFSVRRQDFFLSAVRDTNLEIASFVLVIAAVSLLVGALGIVNVMLVTVTERTREIGIRRALGASRSHILFQFLIEATVLGLFGGLLGIAAGAAFNRAQIGPGVPLPWDWMVYSFVICAGIGSLSGVYPATRAAYENVLDALRYE